MKSRRIGNGMKFLVHVIVLALCFSVFAADISDGIAVYRDPADYALWHTATNCTFELQLDFPQFATTAHVEISGVRFFKAYSNVTAKAVNVVVPRPKEGKFENVYRIEATYDDGTRRSARVGVVRGQGVGCEPEEGVPVVLAWNESETKKFATPRAVIPVPPSGDGVLSVNGEAVDTGLNGDRGWYALGPAKNADTFYLLFGGFSACLKAVGPGFALLFR